LKTENSPLLQDIEEFTRTFNRPDWTIDNYINNINEAFTGRRIPASNPTAARRLPQ
jgi:hypothetical protein